MLDGLEYRHYDSVGIVFAGNGDGLQFAVGNAIAEARKVSYKPAYSESPRA
jgi:glucosamine 6-phosphate synthetase-like amidotransferase/phosphosugar isomerase protein